MKNNNKKVVSFLAQKEYRADRGKQLVLTGAVAFAVMMLFCVFSFALGKLETDVLRNARERGAVSDTALERATQEQYEEIKELPYIKDVGRYIQFGYALGDRAAVIDDVAWEKIKSPAYTDIHGNYPMEKMDVMLPIRTLERLGIANPEIGMELPVVIEFSEERQEEFTFRLCGYYTEYIATVIYGPPDAYFSQAFLEAVSEEEERELTLYLRQDDRVSGRQVERNLYRDIDMRDIRQQFLGNDTSVEVAMFTMAGGFDAMFALAAAILLSAGLLVYNVMRISYEQKIRQYGLLKTLGTTDKQLRAIVCRQTARNVLEGSLLGAAVGALLVLCVLPLLLSRMYLYRFGSAAGMITFHPFLLAASVFFVGSATFLCSSLAIRSTVKLTPVEAANYMETAAGQTYDRKDVRKNKRRRFRLWRMAWRNILCFRRRFLVSAVCLTLGMTVSLGVVMITQGADTVNQIEHDYWDIIVGTDVTIMDYNEIELGSHRKNEDGIVPLFPDELLQQIQGLAGIKESIVVTGAFAEILLDEEALAILRGEQEQNPWWPYRTTCLIQKVSDEFLGELKAFAQERDLALDVDAVIEGEGMIQMHEHQLSPAQIELSRNDIGKTFGVYDIVNKKKVKDMRFCGYLDFAQEGLPEFAQTTRFDDNVYFLISEKGFRNIKAKEQTFELLITSEPDCRAALADEVRGIVEEYNGTLAGQSEYWLHDEWLALRFFSKLDMFKEMRDYIIANRLLMGALCGILLLMGIVNYVNVTITGLTVRRKEFAVMESIGLTSRQLKKMLVLEGFFYSLIIMALTGVFGSWAFWQIGRQMKERMGYFMIGYPVAEFAASSVALFLSCALIVLSLYRKYGEGSVARRLRVYAD